MISKKSPGSLDVHRIKPLLTKYPYFDDVLEALYTGYLITDTNLVFYVATVRTTENCLNRLGKILLPLLILMTDNPSVYCDYVNKSPETIYNGALNAATSVVAFSSTKPQLILRYS